MRYALTMLSAMMISAAALALVQPGEIRANSYDGKVKACNGEPVQLRPAEKETLILHNQERAERDMPRLCIQQRIQKAARGHSADMIQKEYFSHDSKDGTTYDERIREAGYTPEGSETYRTAENIAGGSGAQGSPRDIHRNWMQSDGHRENILDRGLRQVGIGVAYGEYEDYDDYRMYTVDFGFRRG